MTHFEQLHIWSIFDPKVDNYHPPKYYAIDPYVATFRSEKFEDPAAYIAVPRLGTDVAIDLARKRGGRRDTLASEICKRYACSLKMEGRAKLTETGALVLSFEGATRSWVFFMCVEQSLHGAILDVELSPRAASDIRLAASTLEPCPSESTTLAGFTLDSLTKYTIK
jgi:hypothetical protein